jgi:hypothetical protein
MIESTDIANFPAIDDQAADPRHCDHNADIERRVGLRSNARRGADNVAAKRTEAAAEAAAEAAEAKTGEGDLSRLSAR